MSKFIDAEKLKASVQKGYDVAKENEEYDDEMYETGRADAYEDIIHIIDYLQQEQSVTATGQVFTNPAPKNIIVENDQWDNLLSQFDNGQRVRIILVKEDAE